MGRIRPSDMRCCVSSYWTNCHRPLCAFHRDQTPDIVDVTTEINRLLASLSDSHPHLTILSNAADLVGEDDLLLLLDVPPCEVEGNVIRH